MSLPWHNEQWVEDPELFMAMEDLELVAQGVVEGALHGLHRSPYIGFSVEFDAHREYQLGDDLLIVATDRISAFDSVLPCGIPDKGKVLNQLSVFWFEKTAHVVPNHLKEAINDIGQLDPYRPPDYSYPASLAGRSMLVRKADRVPVECVVRGYLSGSAWAEYSRSGPSTGRKPGPD